MTVRLAHHLDQRAENAVKDEEHAGNLAAAAWLGGIKPDDDKQRDAFQPRFIKLRGVARNAVVRAGENHAPRHIRRPSPQFAVNEIADAPEKQSRRNHRRDIIGHIPKAFAFLATKEPQREHHAEQPAVERHAAFPNLERIEQILRPVAHAIKEHVTDAPAEDDAEHQIRHEIAHLLLVPGRVGLRALHTEQIGAAEADDVHQAVPGRVNRAELENIGIKIGESEHEK